MKRIFGLPAFVADRDTAITYGTGIQLDFSKFIDAKYGEAGKRVIPAGTVIEPTSEAGKPALLCVPAAATAGKPALILKETVEEELAGTTGHGAWAGGAFYEALLPEASGSPRVLSAAHKTQLGARFAFLPSQDIR